MSDDPRGMDKDDLVSEVVRLRALLDQQMSAAPGIGPEVSVHGGVSSTTGDPFVQMRAGEAVWQMTTTEIRQHALLCLDAAVEAERDAAAVKLLTDLALAGGDSKEEAEKYAGGFLMMMRDHRVDWMAKWRKEG